LNDLEATGLIQSIVGVKIPTGIQIYESKREI
jgi:hypothetical protein